MSNSYSNTKSVFVIFFELSSLDSKPIRAYCITSCSSKSIQNLKLDSGYFTAVFSMTNL